MNSDEPADLQQPAVAKHSTGQKFTRILEYSVALLLTVGALAMHVRFFLKAGGLWRDEVVSVSLAGSNSMADLIADLHSDSFPLAWPLLLRFWEQIKIGQSDQGLRLLGLIVGLSIIAVIWRNAKRLGLTAPVLSVALLGFTSAMICYGDSIRAYGLGVFLALLSMGLIWEMTRNDSAKTFVWALAASLLSVHILFFNCVLLLTACCAAFAVTLPKRQWKRAGRVLAVGVICAASMLIYLMLMRQRIDFKVFQTPLNVPTIQYNAERSVEFQRDGNVRPSFVVTLVWYAAIAGGLLTGVAVLAWEILKRQSDQRRDVTVFCLVYLVFGMLTYGAFLKILSYRLQPWYYLSALALIAISLDGLLGSVKSIIFRVFMVMIALGFALYAAVPVWENAGTRRTNVDLVAAQVQRVAVKGDVVVMAPWIISGPFLRYYHGPATVTAIPPVSFLTYQKFDLLLKFMEDRNAMAPVIDQLSDTLRSGHRVWIVGYANFPSSPPASRFFQEKPDPIYGWLVDSYQNSWHDEVFYALKQNANTLLLASSPTDQPIYHLEDASLYMAEGWKGRSGSTTQP